MPEARLYLDDGILGLSKARPRDSHFSSPMIMCLCNLSGLRVQYFTCPSRLTKNSISRGPRRLASCLSLSVAMAACRVEARATGGGLREGGGKDEDGACQCVTSTTCIAMACQRRQAIEETGTLNISFAPRREITSLGPIDVIFDTNSPEM
jgi:hypothetical protein